MPNWGNKSLTFATRDWILMLWSHDFSSCSVELATGFCLSNAVSGGLKFDPMEESIGGVWTLVVSWALLVLTIFQGDWDLAISLWATLDVLL